MDTADALKKWREEMAEELKHLDEENARVSAALDARLARIEAAKAGVAQIIRQLEQLVSGGGSAEQVRTLYARARELEELAWYANARCRELFPWPFVGDDYRDRKEAIAQIDRFLAIPKPREAEGQRGGAPVTS
jgi:hypothetical protein